MNLNQCKACANEDNCKFPEEPCNPWINQYGKYFVYPERLIWNETPDYTTRDITVDFT